MSFSGELDGKESICNAGAAAAAAKSLQSCPTLFEPLDGSPPGSSVHGIFQARVMQESRVQSLGWEDPLGRGMATLSSSLPWAGYSP